jgi:hypothetical protein
MNISDKRPSVQENPCMVPSPVEGKPGFMEVDTTWGEIQPMQAAPGIRTVDELEVHQFQEKGRPIIDGRTADFYKDSAIPGAKNIPHYKITGN